MKTVTGFKKLDQMMVQLGTKVAKKAAAAGTRAMMTPIARAMRKGVSASSASVDLKRAARKSIKARMKKSKRFGQSAKVGFSVGKQKKNPDRSGNNTGGVGASPNNMHWFILGTKDRQTKSGKSTGRIKPIFAGIAAQALATSKGEAIAASGKKIMAVLEKEARKRRK